MVYTIKLPFTSDGMKAVLTKEMLRENLNDCAGEFVIRPLRLKVVAWYYIYNFFSEFLCYDTVILYFHTRTCEIYGLIVGNKLFTLNTEHCASFNIVAKNIW